MRVNEHHFPAINAPTAGGEEEVASSQAAAEPTSALPARLPACLSEHNLRGPTHTGGEKVTELSSKTRIISVADSRDVTLGSPGRGQPASCCLSRAEGSLSRAEPSLKTEVKLSGKNLPSSPSVRRSYRLRSGGGNF